MASSYAKGVAILIGTIIGAGVLAIPYTVYKAGFWTGIIMILGLGIALVMLHLYLGEVALRTKQKHQLTGYAEKYLGGWGKKIMFASMLVGNYGALTAYIIGSGATLKSIFGGQEVLYSLMLFTILSVIVYKGLKAVGKSEFYMQAVVILILVGMSVYALFFAKAENMTGFSFTKMFIPYGTIFFAFIGTSAIPEVREMLRREAKLMKKAILVGSIVPIVIYALFAIAVVAAVGPSFDGLHENERIATVALGEILGEKINILGNLLATFTMTTSFLTIGLAMMWVYQYDFRIRKQTAWAITVFFPLVLALSGMTSFIKTIGVVGAVAGGIEGILIVMMHKRAKKLGERKPEYSIKHYPILSYMLIALFVLGIILTVI